MFILPLQFISHSAYQWRPLSMGTKEWLYVAGIGHVAHGQDSISKYIISISMVMASSYHSLCDNVAIPSLTNVGLLYR